MPFPEDISTEKAYFYAMENLKSIPAFAQAALKAAAESGDALREAWASLLLGVWADRFDDHQRALAFLEIARKRGESLGETLLTARALYFTAVSLSREPGGDAAQIPTMMQLLERYDSVYTELDKAMYRNSLAVCSFYAEKIEDAVRNYYDALAFAVSSGNSFVTVSVLNNLGSLQIDLGNFEEAQSLFEQALAYEDLSGSLGSIQGLSGANLALVLERSGRYQEAVDAAAAWIDRLDEIPVHSRLIVPLSMAQAYARMGNFEESRRLVSLADAIARDNPSVDAVNTAYYIAQTILIKAIISLGTGDIEEALTLSEDGIRSLEGHEEPELLDRLREQAAVNAAALGKWELAYRYASAALQETQRKIRVSARGISLTLGVKHELEKAYRERDLCRELSLTDPLTGLLNRRFFGDAASSMLSLAKREGIPVALAMIDLDRFKVVNDTYGHAFGDIVLVEFAKSMKARLRQEDVLVRYGGEEFCLILPGAESDSVKYRLEAALLEFSRIVYPHGESELSGFTWSAGVACSPNGSASLDALIKQADKALYSAKEAGRAKVSIAPSNDR